MDWPVPAKVLAKSAAVGTITSSIFIVTFLRKVARAIAHRV